MSGAMANGKLSPGSRPGGVTEWKNTEEQVNPKCHVQINVGHYRVYYSGFMTPLKRATFT